MRAVRAGGFVALMLLRADAASANPSPELMLLPLIIGAAAVAALFVLACLVSLALALGGVLLARRHRARQPEKSRSGESEDA